MTDQVDRRLEPSDEAVKAHRLVPEERVVDVGSCRRSPNFGVVVEIGVDLLVHPVDQVGVDELLDDGGTALHYGAVDGVPVEWSDEVWKGTVSHGSSRRDRDGSAWLPWRDGGGHEADRAIQDSAVRAIRVWISHGRCRRMFRPAG